MPEAGDMLTGLHGLRDPGVGVWDLLAALGLGLILAGLLGWLIRATRSAHATPPDLARRIEATRALSAAERAAALADLLRAETDRHAPGPDPWTRRAAARFDIDAEALEAFCTALYRPDPPPDTAPIEGPLLGRGRR